MMIANANPVAVILLTVVGTMFVKHEEDNGGTRNVSGSISDGIYVNGYGRISWQPTSYHIPY